MWVPGDMAPSLAFWIMSLCKCKSLLTENDFSITLSLPLPLLYDWFQLVFCRSIKKLQIQGIQRGLLQYFSAYDSKNKPFNISLDITRMVNKTTTSGGICPSQNLSSWLNVIFFCLLLSIAIYPN